MLIMYLIKGKYITLPIFICFVFPLLSWRNVDKNIELKGEKLDNMSCKDGVSLLVKYSISLVLIEHDWPKVTEIQLIYSKLSNSRLQHYLTCINASQCVAWGTKFELIIGSLFSALFNCNHRVVRNKECIIYILTCCQ